MLYALPTHQLDLAIESVVATYQQVPKMTCQNSGGDDACTVAQILYVLT